MTGNSVALDTNQAIAVLNGVAGAVEWLGRFESVCIPIIVIAELKFGALKSRNAGPNLQRISDLCDQCALLDIRLSTTDCYANLRLACEAPEGPFPKTTYGLHLFVLTMAFPLRLTTRTFPSSRVCH